MSIKTSNGNSIFAATLNGIRSSFYYLAQGKDGITLENIINPSKEGNMYPYMMNYSFSSYLASNFANFDTNGDGKITENEINAYTNKLTTKGLSYNELVQLCSQGTSNSLLETVLNNFSQVDTNGDGRVTNAEIAAYNIDQQREEMEDEFPRINTNSISIFYPSSSSSVETQPSKSSQSSSK